MRAINQPLPIEDDSSSIEDDSSSIDQDQVDRLAVDSITKDSGVFDTSSSQTGHTSFLYDMPGECSFGALVRALFIGWWLRCNW